MTQQIRPLTTADIKAMAREAAEHGTPLKDANHFTPGTPGWKLFNEAYQAREAQMHTELVLEVA